MLPTSYFKQNIQKINREIKKEKNKERRNKEKMKQKQTDIRKKKFNIAFLQ